jgi:hypothetical protein
MNRYNELRKQQQHQSEANARKRNNAMALDGTTPLQRESRKRSERHVLFQQRTANLARYELHINDPMLHVAAGPHWKHTRAVQEAFESGNATAHAQASMSAMIGTTASLETELDRLIHLLFFTKSTTPFSSFIANLEAESTKISVYLTTGVYAKVQSFFDYVRTSGTCRGPNDYRLNGTGQYHLGCLPFLDEHWFDWIRDYPVNDPTHNIWDITQGPGPIQWPAVMVMIPCSKPRNPELSCPLNRPVKTYNTNGTLVTVPANGVNFGNWLTNPVLFFEDLCITNMCTVSTDDYNDPSIRPQCPGCDTCPQTYYSAFEYGYTDGWKVFATYDSVLRYLLLNFFIQAGGSAAYFLFIVAYLCTEFPNILFAWVPLANSNTIAYIVLIACLYGDWFVRETPGRFVWSYLFVQFIGLFSIVAQWVLFALYVVGNFGQAILGIQVLPFFNQLVMTVVRDFTPGALLVFLLKPYVSVISFIVPIIGTSFTGNPATINAVIAEFEKEFTVTEPSFADTFYAVASFYQAFKLVGLGVAYFLLAFIVSGAVTSVIFAAFYIIGELALIVSAFFVFLLQTRVYNNARTLEQVQSQTLVSQQALARQSEQLNEISARLRTTAEAQPKNFIGRAFSTQLLHLSEQARSLADNNASAMASSTLTSTSSKDAALAIEHA